MAKLVEVLARELKVWPKQESFFCDPDGEIRGTTNISHDFYPKESVGNEDRGDDFGDDSVCTVNEAMWQSERDRQKGGEWKRNRGKTDKSPVGNTHLVEVRFRDGATEIDKGYPRWCHTGDRRDIMAYRVLEKPEQEEKEVELTDHKFKVGDKVKVIAKDEGEWCQVGNIHTVRVLKESHEYGQVYVVDKDNECAWIRECNLELVESSVSIGTITYTVDLNTEPAMHKIEELQAKWDQFDGPLKWRDGVSELEAYIEEFTRERDALINRLALEGFALIPAMTAVMGVGDVPTVIPCSDWQIGDILEVVAHKGANSHEFEIGEHVRIDGFDLDDDNLPVRCYALDESDFWYLKYEEAKFIRRP